MIINGVTAPGHSFFFEKYFVFATLPKPTVQRAVVLITKETLFPTV
jgi:hypothetical protein